VFHPQQIEFARLNMTYTVMSKRKLLELVQGDFVSGWDDPRMPTICGMRRRGMTPEALREFCKTIGVTKYNSMTDKVVLENCIRDHLNQVAPRVMGVLNPLRVVIEIILKTRRKNWMRLIIPTTNLQEPVKYHSRK